MKNVNLFKDSRGYVGSIYRKDGINEYAFNWVEDRISYSNKNVIRGFHGDFETYKLTYCLYGKLRLIIYDLETQKKESIILTPESEPILICPNTLNAHHCLSDECILFYKWSKFYNLDSQFSVVYNDVEIAPNWSGENHVVSDRDKNSNTLKEFYETRR